MREKEEKEWEIERRVEERVSKAHTHTHTHTHKKRGRARKRKKRGVKKEKKRMKERGNDIKKFIYFVVAFTFLQTCISSYQRRDQRLYVNSSLNLRPQKVVPLNSNPGPHKVIHRIQ